MFLTRNFILCLCIFSVLYSEVFAATLPDEENVNNLAQKAIKTAEDFFNKTLEIRMRYEYAGGFLDPNDRIKLLKLAAQASADLEKIAYDQNNLKKQIEDYQGDDWEVRFGQTGLWRRLAADLSKTESEMLEINAVSAPAGDIKPECPPLLIRGSCDSIKMAMAKIKCFGPTDSNELENLAQILDKSECNENPEMLLSLAILQNKYHSQRLKNTLSRFPHISFLFGKIVLDCLMLDNNFDSLSPAAAECIVIYAGQSNAADYKDLLIAIAENGRFKTPDTLAVAGISVLESDPRKAIKFFIESSALQFQKKETMLEIDAHSTAQKAANLAYDNFIRQNVDCNLALAAFENYTNIALDKMTDEMRYNYGQILLGCGRIKNAIETFKKLAENKSIWADRANFQLIKIQLNADQAENLLPQLRKLILETTGPDKTSRQLRLEAMDFYCRTALSCESNQSAARVLDLLDSAEFTPDFPYDLYRARATFQLGLLEQSAKFMVKAVDINDISIAQQALPLLSEILDKIELWQQNAHDFNEMLENCANLAQFACGLLNDSQTQILLAEISIIRGDKITPPAQTDNGWLRTKARLLMAQGNFQQAAQLWAQIAETHRNQALERNRKSYGFWQARFYELECLSKLPHTDLKALQHSIEVLKGTYPEIPPPWSEKFDLLKQHCFIN